MKKQMLMVWFLTVIFVGTAFAQTRTITGFVMGEDGSPIPGVNVLVKGTTTGTVTDVNGKYQLEVPPGPAVLIFSFIGYSTQEVRLGANTQQNVTLANSANQLSELQGQVPGVNLRIRGISSVKSKRSAAGAPGAAYKTADMFYEHQEQQPAWNTEEYDGIEENIFHEALRKPLSTFSIDVDAASYSNVRRLLNNGQQPPKDAVRIEEMINYFDYDYAQPKGEDPFSIYTEMAPAPWNEKHMLVHIGLQGKIIPTQNLPASNLVFLIDVSGSMDDLNKLPLLKASFKMLVEQLRAQDRVAIVVYAGAAGLVLPSTSGAEKRTIIDALENLQAGGSTAGGEGIRLAYKIAKENFRENGNNRVILATDGDFNVGESSNASMERLIESKREEGVFLTVLGYGMGNYKDSKMEVLADKGNGNYAYIDNLLEAKKVLVNEFGGTLFTIAKDVKLQIEFNPAKVKAYRLIGYENRLLRDEDFNNDKKDAGELGSGHTVTALYEIIPVGVESAFFKIDELKYQTLKIDAGAKTTDELMTVKFRYKKPNENTSKLLVHALKEDVNKNVSENFRWSAAVAAFGMRLRESEFVNQFSYEQIAHLAQSAKGVDKEGYRIEFINMVKSFGLTASR